MAAVELKMFMLLIGILLSFLGMGTKENITYEETYSSIPIEESLSWGMTPQELTVLLGEPAEQTESDEAVILKYYDIETMLGISAETEFTFGSKELVDLEDEIYTTGLCTAEFLFQEDTYEYVSDRLRNFYGEMQLSDIMPEALTESSTYMEKWSKSSWILNRLSDEDMESLKALFEKNNGEYIVSEDDCLMSITMIGKDKEEPPVSVKIDASYLVHLEHILGK